MHKTRGELIKFFIVGLFVLAVDASTYSLFLLRFSPSLSKGLAFICGTTAAYLLNKSWTFGKKGYSTHEAAKFILLYAAALGVNVGVNAAGLYVSSSLLVAYVLATAVSATFNFLGQKFFVFKDDWYRTLWFRNAYIPPKEQNRMRHVGDVEKARKEFFNSPSRNLSFLLEHRYGWMNPYIKDGAEGIEVGCGAGISKLYIRAKSFLLTDYTDKEWLDVKNVDALRTPFAVGSFDFVVASNMIHHVPYPIKFFEEMNRILKPGGVLLIQEINASFFMRLILRLTRHEGYSFDANVFDRSVVCTDPNDLWSANCAIPNLLFDDVKKFEHHMPYFKIKLNRYCEFFNFLNSGGVIAKTFYVPLPVFLLRFLRRIDDALACAAPSIFALQRHIVLQKNN